MNFIAISGWTGSLAVLSAFILVSLGVFQGTKYPFQIMNFLGALGMLIYAFSEKAWPFVPLEFAWAVTSLFKIVYLWGNRAGTDKSLPRSHD